MGQARTDYVKAKIEEIEKGFGDFANMLNKLFEGKAEAIRQWAAYLEELINAGEMKDMEVSAISWYIKKRVRELGIEIHDNYINQALAAKYKRAYKEDHKPTNPEEKPIELLTGGEAYDRIRRLEDQTKETRFRTSQEIIALKAVMEKDGYTPPEELKISVKKVIGYVESARAVREVADQLFEIAKKIEYFAPNEEDDKRLKHTFETLAKVLEPFKDDRWTKSTRDWFIVQKDANEYGKNNAAKRNLAITTAGEARKLTSEQIQNKQSETYDLAREVISSPGWLSELFEWHAKYREPSIAERKVNLSGVLSDKA